MNKVAVADQAADQGGEAIERITAAVVEARPFLEQIGEIAVAAQIWRACRGNESLATRWVWATRGDHRLVARCIVLGLEPEQLARLHGAVPGHRTLDVVNVLSDQQLLDALARRPAPAWCTCGWDEWEATGEGWECPHCHVEVRRDPRE